MSRRPDAPIVREATGRDLERAVDLYIRVAGEGLWIGAELPVDRDARLAKWGEILAHSKETMFVVEMNGDIVGQATMQWVGAAELGMLVDVGHRRRGIGSALVVACVEWAEARGIHKIELKVWPHNEAAIALYERHGFEREGYLKRHYRRRNGELWDCIIMGRQLPDVGRRMG